MIKFFIFYNDLEFATTLYNNIADTVNNSRLLGIYPTISQINIINCNQTKPHVIISDEITLKKLSKILDFEYIPIKIAQNNSFSIEKICNQIKKLSLNTKYARKIELLNFRRYVYQELQRLQFNPLLARHKLFIRLYRTIT